MHLCIFNKCATCVAKLNCKNNDCFQTGFLNAYNWSDTWIAPRQTQTAGWSSVKQTEQWFDGDTVFWVNLQMTVCLCILNCDKRKYFNIERNETHHLKWKEPCFTELHRVISALFHARHPACLQLHPTLMLLHSVWLFNVLFTSLL